MNTGTMCILVVGLPMIAVRPWRSDSIAGYVAVSVDRTTNTETILAYGSRKMCESVALAHADVLLMQMLGALASVPDA